MTNIIERFMSHVMPEPNTGCWLWISYGNPKGYGHFYVNNKTHRAHRFSYSLFVGNIPDGIQVLHKCDTPSCVNPDHLFLGTNHKNMIDKVLKGRHPSKLTQSQVDEIRTLSGTNTSIAKKYGVDRTLITRIKDGTIWNRPKPEYQPK